METLDTEKLKDVIEMMKKEGAVFLKYKELIIEFPRNSGDSTTTVVGFETNSEAEEETESKAGKRPIKPRPTGYTALLGENRPTFPRPAAEGR